MKHRKVRVRLENRRKAFDAMSPSDQAKCKSPGSMKGRK